MSYVKYYNSNLILYYSKGNLIDGESFLILNDVEVASMGFKIGPASKLRKLLENLRSADTISGNQKVLINGPNETGSTLRIEIPSTSTSESTETESTAEQGFL